MFQNGEIQMVLEMFEKPSQQKNLPYTGGSMEREDRAHWKSGHFYTNGAVNAQFQAFLNGYAFGKAVERQAA